MSVAAVLFALSMAVSGLEDVHNECVNECNVYRSVKKCR